MPCQPQGICNAVVAERMNINFKSEKEIWKEAVVTYYKLRITTLIWRESGNLRKASAKITCVHSQKFVLKLK